MAWMKVVEGVMREVEEGIRFVKWIAGPGGMGQLEDLT
jgi:hypothetical protein